MPLPKIIIIGAAKCGTTALWYNLDKHPDIHMATRTDTTIEMRFWKHKFWDNGLEWYSNRFVEDKINGEKTPSYYLRSGRMKIIKKYIPDVKLIVCFRNPADRAYSNAMMSSKGRGVGRIGGKLLKPGMYMHNLNNNVLPFFDKEQIHICITEYMKNNTTEEMRKIFDFIGVRDLNLPSKIIDGVLRRNRSRQEDIKASRQEPYYRVWSRYSNGLKGLERERLLSFYKEHNEKLFDFMGFEVKEWMR